MPTIPSGGGARMPPEHQSTLAKAAKSRPRPIRLLLRDNSVVEANVYLGEGQNLAGYLSSRKGYVNLLGVRWLKSDRTAKHYVLNVDRILWAAPLEEDVPMSSVPHGVTLRHVEVYLDGGLTLQAGLFLATSQRLSDYFGANAGFILLKDARLMPRNAWLGDILINPWVIEAVHDIDVEAAVVEAEKIEE